MLRDYVSTKLNAAQIGDLLTMAGFELEGIETVEGDDVLDIKVVSNRGDGLSVYGLAREVLAKDPGSTPTELYEMAHRRFPLADEAQAEVKSKAAVEIETSDCLRYGCRVFADVPGGESPAWIQKRLRQAGMRPLGLLVDLTNYVMLEIGQPLHAFDLDKLDGAKIVVRKARAGEKLITLNGDQHVLNPDQMMVCDAARPVAAAGVMGGLDSEVGEGTSNVLLESANFLNTSVRRTRKQMNLSTEASYRFERSVDPELVIAGLNRVAMLLREAGAERCLVPGVIDVYPSPVRREQIRLRMSRTTRLLGMEISSSEARSYLERLGFDVSGEGEPFSVTPPTWRPDVVREDDLVEEVGRVHGYERIPDVLPHGATTLGGVFGRTALEDRLREALIRLGFVQTMSHDLRDRHPLDSPNLKAIGPRNPHSPETAWLRTSLLPSLADVARRNGGKDVHIFEIGAAFGEGPGGPFCARRLGMLSVGRVNPQDVPSPSAENADFWTIKGALSAALEAVGVEATFEPDDSDPRFHPTRVATVRTGGARLGFVGQIHPTVAEQCGLSEQMVMAALNLDLLEPAAKRFGYKAISRNPAVRRDLAFLISKSVAFSRIEGALSAACGEVLEKQWLFDVYEGQGVPAGSHSLAVAIQLRKIGGNFTDEEANQVRERAVQALESLGATMR